MIRNFLLHLSIILLSLASVAQTTSTVVKRGTKYDTIIHKHVDKPPVKQTPKQVVQTEVVLPTPEFVNQPYYFDKDENKLIKLETSSAQLLTKKKTLGLKGAKQFFSMDDVSSKVRFTAKPNIVFFIKTSGDVIDLTSYIKLYKFITEDQKRVVTITSKEGFLNDKEEEKGKQISFSVKSISNDNYQVQFTDPLEAGNMALYG